MKSAFVFQTKNLSLAIASAILLMAGNARATVTVYQASDSTTNFIPDTDDGTPSRPTGSMMGNTVTLSNTHCFITGVTVKVGTNDAGIAPQDVTLSLYQNDGAADPGGSGLLQPGTLISSATATQVSLSGGIVPVTFSFPSLLVPDTFTFILQLSPGSSGSSFTGVASDNSSPQIGSAFNTLWFGNGTLGNWTTSSSWAINDGAAVNFIDATFLAADTAPVPEPSGLFFLTMGSAAVWFHYRRVRRIG